MTRDEHIKIEMDRLMAGPALCGQHPGIVREVAETNVNCFVRHGILKLDEPNADDIFHERMAKHYGETNRNSILKKLDAAGLRIVEK